ncbi:hypothetical protein Fcan01_12372 [Folsomia candida]|uniref:Uncharacterized protein n=1 Tax=Folsomia candida TaxID=158441 RepID=A0A226E6I8_FOLCA|nr:hypothetical protein Fcan01_12372 [Folsomia candida]
MSLSCSGAPRGFQDSDDMAFIDEDLLWCSDNDSKLMDLSCLEGGPGGGGGLVSSSTGFTSAGGGGGNNHGSSNSSHHPLGPFPSNHHHSHHHLRFPNVTNNTVSSTSGPVVSSSSSPPSSVSPQAASSAPAFNFMNNGGGGGGGGGGTGHPESGDAPELPTLSQLSQADLNGLVSTLDDDDDDWVKQLGDEPFELDPLLDEILEPNRATNHPNHPSNNSNNNGISHSSNNNQSQQGQQQQQQQQQHQQQPTGQNGHFGNNPHHHQSLQQFLAYSQQNQQQQNSNGTNGIEMESSRLQNVPRRRKKPPDSKMGMEISLEEAVPSILHLARASTSNNNPSSGGGKMGSILANTLCGPHNGQHNKANIAAANPILAGRTPELQITIFLAKQYISLRPTRSKFNRQMFGRDMDSENKIYMMTKSNPSLGQREEACEPWNDGMDQFPWNERTPTLQQQHHHSCLLQALM